VASIAIVVTAALLAMALDVSVSSTHRTRVAYVALTGASTAEADGGVVIRLSVRNTTANQVDATLRIVTGDPEDPIALVEQPIHVGAAAEPEFDVRIAGACGLLLTTSIVAGDLQRELRLLSPCLAP
jgi:hypothetical protein